MPPADNQLEYNGLLIGPGTDFVITHIDGLSPPDLKQSESSKSIEHGSHIYASYFMDRVIDLVGMIYGGGDPHAKFMDLREALMPPGTIIKPLMIKWPNLPLLYSYAHPIRKNWQLAPGLGVGVAQFALQFRAGDPLLYAAAESSINIIRGATGVAANAGIESTLPIVTLDGPLTNPVITNQTTGQSLKLNVTLASGAQSVAIDFNNKTIFQGGVSRYGWLDTGSEWWGIAPGNNTLALTADAGTGVSEVRWRSAWV